MKEKAQCVLWYHETKSQVTVQRKFKNEYGRPPPDVKSIKAWYSKFVETGSVGDLSRNGRPSVSDDIVDAVREAFQRSPDKSRRRVSNELRVPQRTVVKTLHKRRKLYTYKVQILQYLQSDDGPGRASFATEIMHRIVKTTIFLSVFVFSDEATFHTSGVSNGHNVRIWGSENPHVVFQNKRGSPKVNV
jgi:hypothetical protein